MCTDNTYFADLKEEAYKIPMNEPEMIQEGIVLLDKNPELRERLVLAAESFIEQYSWEAIAKQHIDFWRAL
jgi:glycosyltransferase involved in cell wall biosynthesis